jgi:hypothetical protein
MKLTQLEWSKTELNRKSYEFYKLNRKVSGRRPLIPENSRAFAIRTSLKDSLH